MVNQANLGLGDKNHLILVCQNRLIVGRVGKDLDNYRFTFLEASRDKRILGLAYSKTKIKQKQRGPTI